MYILKFVDDKISVHVDQWLLGVKNLVSKPVVLCVYLFIVCEMYNLIYW